MLVMRQYVRRHSRLQRDSDNKILPANNGHSGAKAFACPRRRDVEHYHRDNVTYQRIVLKPEPFYGNMTVTQNPIPLEGATTEIIITAFDFWENPIGPGIMISVHTTAGKLDPLYGLTDANSQFRTTLTSPDNGSYAEIQEFARGWNGTYYPLQKRIETVTTVTPTPSPTATAQPSRRDAQATARRPSATQTRRLRPLYPAPTPVPI
jgi:hypothetical protein